MERGNPTDGKESREVQQPVPFMRHTEGQKSLEGLQTAWKVFLLLFLGAYIGPAAVYLLGSGLFQPQSRNLRNPEFLLYLESGNFVVLLGLTALLAFMEKRPFGQYGLPLRHAFRTNFWLGFLFGLAEASVLIGVIQIFRGYSFGNWALHGPEILRWGTVHLVLFVFVGLYEEFLFRGYAQFSLSKFVGFWPAAVLLSIVFGMTHLSSAGENLVGATSVALVGLLFAFTLKRSGNLWYAVGLHGGFDWAQSFLYSVPDSGELLNRHLSNAQLHGPAWITGASVGPEGSVFCFLTMGLQFLVVMWLFPAKKSEAAADLAEAQN